MLILSILFPVVLGLGILLKRDFGSRKKLIAISGAGLLMTAALGLAVAFGGEQEMLIFSFGKNLDIYFHVDALGTLFALTVNVVWVLSGFYAFEYMKH